MGRKENLDRIAKEIVDDFFDLMESEKGEENSYIHIPFAITIECLVKAILKRVTNG